MKPDFCFVFHNRSNIQPRMTTPKSKIQLTKVDLYFILTYEK
ncbi:hypothetical protein SAMN05428961_104440 [Paenibacillus sp. OK060]|nr:hypothetical protein SAMN05428961_104440 [Paenibacillus sp. OK060]